MGGTEEGEPQLCWGAVDLGLEEEVGVGGTGPLDLRFKGQEAHPAVPVVLAGSG